MGLIKKKETAVDHAIFLRRAKALELRVNGKMTMRQICQETGVSIATVYNDIQWMIAHETKDCAEYVHTAREIENRRMDELLSKAMTSLESAGDIDEQTKLMSVALKISERRAKLLGLDAPIKTEVDATISGEPVTPSAARKLMQQYFTNDVTPTAPSADDDQPN